MTYILVLYRFNGPYFPLSSILDLGSTSFIISPEAAKAFCIPVVKRIRPIRTKDVSGKEISTEGLFTVPLGQSCGKHRFYDEENQAFKVSKTAGD